VVNVPEANYRFRLDLLPEADWYIYHDANISLLLDPKIYLKMLWPNDLLMPELEEYDCWHQFDKNTPKSIPVGMQPYGAYFMIFQRNERTAKFFELANTKHMAEAIIESDVKIRSLIETHKLYKFGPHKFYTLEEMTR
jgi:hypothetical protein